MELPQKFIDELILKSETGMGYQIATVVLNNGRQYQQVVILECHVITSIKGLDNIPFSSDEIAQIILTHAKWDFNKK